MTDLQKDMREHEVGNLRSIIANRFTIEEIRQACIQCYNGLGQNDEDCPYCGELIRNLEELRNE